MPPAVWQCPGCKRYFVTPTRHHRVQDPGGQHWHLSELEKISNSRQWTCSGYPVLPHEQREDIIAAYLLGGDAAVDAISLAEVRSQRGQEADP